jgi:uncharacterized tellurite resistance protein B-like protein
MADRKDDLRALLKGIVAIAAADGAVVEEEMRALEAICTEVFGKNMDMRALRTAVEEVAESEKISIYSNEMDVSAISDGMKKTIIQSMYFVMISDGSVEERELDVLSEMGTLLGLSEAVFARHIREITGAAC